MNNALNAKLSKLIYALASDDPEYLSKAGAFDRLLKRWMVYSRIAERIENCGKHLSVVLEDAVLENGADKSHYIDEANAIIERFGLVRDEAALSVIEAEEALKTEQEVHATSEPQKSAPKHHGNMHQIRMQEKIENYSAMQKVASMQISRMRFIFPHIK